VNLAARALLQAFGGEADRCGADEDRWESADLLSENARTHAAKKLHGKFGFEVSGAVRALQGSARSPR
jgi:hypothetical protein